MLLVRFASGRHRRDPHQLGVQPGRQLAFRGRRRAWQPGRRQDPARPPAPWLAGAGRVHEVPDDLPQTFASEITHFLDVVQHGAASQASFDHAARVLQLTLAAYTAAAEHCVVALPEDPTQPGVPVGDVSAGDRDDVHHHQPGSARHPRSVAAEAIALARDAGFAGLSFDSRAAAQAVDEQRLGRGAGPVRAGRCAARRSGTSPSPGATTTSGKPICASCPGWPRRRASWARRGPRPTCPLARTSARSDENFDWHVARLRPIAEVLRDEGCRFGIEYIGPKTYRAAFRHEFIHTLDGVMELIAAIGDRQRRA